MNRKQNIAALIEKNRIVLLRLVFCWLTTALCLRVRGDKPLPRRLARFVGSLLFKAEKAAANLLIAAFYIGQIKRSRSIEFERAAKNFALCNRSFTLGARTVAGIIQRLKALQHLLHNLPIIARRLAKSVAARARVLLMRDASIFAACAQPLAPRRIHALEDALPP